jgi:DNA-binding MarR family transcriptional regulator
MKEKDITTITDNIISMKALFYRVVSKKVFMKSPIAPAAFHVILCLKKNGSLPMSVIGKHLGIPKPNVTALIDRLIDEKLAERMPDKNDRRIINIKLTKQGLEFIEKNKKVIRDHIKQMLSTLTEKELEGFSESLQNVRDILAKISVENEEKNC